MGRTFDDVRRLRLRECPRRENQDAERECHQTCIAHETSSDPRCSITPTGDRAAGTPVVPTSLPP